MGTGPFRGECPVGGSFVGRGVSGRTDASTPNPIGIRFGEPEPTGGCSPGRRQHPCGSVGKGDAQRSRGTKRHIVCDASTDQADRSSRRGGPLDRLDEAFVHASTGHAPKGKDKAVLLAALMAMGTNI